MNTSSSRRTVCDAGAEQVGFASLAAVQPTGFQSWILKAAMPCTSLMDAVVNETSAARLVAQAWGAWAWFGEKACR